ncbi:MAG TPA: serine/threonine protein kinase [Polyangiaceae bacterium]|nr:serine/threonine protein kinase [Polyangiaceae bacterium]
MTAPRIGKRELAREEPATTGQSRTLLFTRALASPYGILIVFPAIVVSVGLFLTLLGQRSLTASNRDLGQRRLAEQAQLVATHLRGALDSADPMLDRLSDFTLEHTPDKPKEAAAAVLLDVMQGHPGVAYVSISFTDGTFQGAYFEGGRVLFQDSRIAQSGTTVRRFEYRGHAALTPLDEAASQYDPRRRDFYVKASAARTRVWTRPYPFYGNHHTGVTRAAPVYLQGGAERRLHAVLTVDFDVDELSRLLRAGELADMHTLLFTGSGTLLAYPRGEQRIAKLPLSLEQALSYRELKDPTLDAFFAKLGPNPRLGRQLLSFDVAGVGHLAALAPVSEDGSLDWTVAYLVPERVFFESLHAYGQRSFGIAAIAVLLALGVSVAFARLVVRVRREAATAREEAKRANQAVRELGSYRLVKCLGKGGMGEVWRAEHRLLAREAAIKLIRHADGEPASKEAQERFRREAQTLAQLRSRNTIELFDYGVSSDGTFFYVMELLEGLDLESLIIKNGPQPPGRVLRLLMQACRSLGEAHQVGLVHRDIKPANLFVCRVADEVDVVKVLDFGLVRALKGDAEDAEPLSTQAVFETTAATSLQAPLDAKLTRAGSVMGTPEFMAPEQALGRKLDGRADLYALGCVGYWLLTGRLVFHKNTPMMTLLAHIQEPAPSLDETVVGGVPHGLKLCIMDCLAKSPDHRPQDARALLDRLAEAERQLEPNQVWTEERAQAWWQKFQPATRASQPAGLTPSPNAQVRIADIGSEG